MDKETILIEGSGAHSVGNGGVGSRPYEVRPSDGGSDISHRKGVEEVVPAQGCFRCKGWRPESAGCVGGTDSIGV